MLLEISPNGMSESRLLPGLLTVLAVNKRQFPESEAMEWEQTVEVRGHEQEGSLVPPWVLVIQFRSSALQVLLPMEPPPY